MSQFIESIEKEPISSDDIRRIVGPGVNIIVYSSLAHIPNLESLLGRENACVILYRWKPFYGHWVALTASDYGNISYFDSYGKGVDHWLTEQDPQMANKLGQVYPYLSRMLEQAVASGRKVDINRKALQAEGSNIADCGRYAALRCVYRHMSNEAFCSMISDNKGGGSVADRNVSLMTSLLTN